MTASGYGAPPPSNKLPELPRILLGLVLDYVRWLILVPMITAWAFYLFMVVVIVLLSFESRIFDLLESGYESYRLHFGPVAWIEGSDAGQSLEPAQERADDQDASVAPAEFDEEDIMPWIFKIWGILAVAAWLLGALRTSVFGPRPQRTLGHKLRLASIAAGACWVLLFLAFFFGSSTFTEGFSGAFVFFTGSTMMVAIVSWLVLPAGALMVSFQRLVEEGNHSA